MKTLFISSFHPHISRNILLTAAFARLKKEKNLRIVLIVPDYKKDYFEKNFGAATTLVEGVALYGSTRSRVGVVFKRLAQMLMDTETVRLRRGFKYYTDHKRWYDMLWRACALLGHSFFVRRVVRMLDQRSSPHDFFLPLFARYHPDALFSCDMQNDNDVALMQCARTRGVKIIGMMRSWDNATQRVMRVWPDHLFVGSRALQEEVTALHGYPAEKITISGQPHYDNYFLARRTAPPLTREEFFKLFGLDAKKKLIVYAPVGDLVIVKYNDMDQFVLELLGRVEAQILVRLPPDEKVNLTPDFKKPNNVTFHRPGQVFKDTQFTDREIRKEDDDSLICEMAYADLVVTGPTSISLDAAYFDKPVIVVNLYPPSERNFFDTVYQYRYTHMQKLFATGGVHFSETPNDLYAAIKNYLKNPALDRDGRARIRELWFSRSQDGNAGRRLAEGILAHIR